MRRYILLLLACLLIATRANAVLAVVQAANNENTAGIDSCVATAVSGNCNNALTATTSGNLLVLITREGRDNTSTVTITDSASQTWTQTPTAGYQSSSSSSRLTMFYIANSVSVTSIDATWTNGSSTRVSIMVFEISGAATSSPLDADVGSTNSGSVTSLTSGSLTTTNANDILIFGAGASANQSSWSSGGSYTLPTNGSANRLGMEYLVVSSTQSAVTTTISDASSGNMAGVFAAFKASGGGGAPACTNSVTLLGVGCKA